MSKVTLDDVGYVPTSATTINNNNALIEQAVENTLSRDGTGPNEMNANLDMNSNRILNLPYPSSNLEPMRKTDLVTLFEEMSDQFIGPQGPQGEQGPQGIQGIQGPQGDQGPQGIQGPPISDGDKGNIIVSGSGLVWTVEGGYVPQTGGVFTGLLTITPGSTAGTSYNTLVLSNGAATGTVGNGAKLILGSNVSRCAIVEGLNTTGNSNGHALVLYTNLPSASPVERMRINANGLVGIGTNNPGSELEIAAIDGDEDARLTLRANVTHTGYVSVNTTSLTLDAGSSKSINFRTGGVSRATMSAAGVMNFASTPTVGGSNTVYHSGNLSLNGAIIQAVYSELGTVSATSAVIPFDDTKPQNTEGSQIFSASITPASITNKVRVRVNIPYSLNTAAGTAIGAIFVTGDASAKAATFEYRDIGTGGHLSLVYEYVPGTVAAQTITVRVGVSDAGTGMVVNGTGASTNRVFGGASRATLTLEELKV